MPNDHPLTIQDSSGRLANLFAAFEEIDARRNMHGSVPIVLFLLSGGLAAASFFVLVDILTWFGLDKLDPALPSAISFVLIFVIWILIFLAFMSALEWLNIVDIKTLAEKKLRQASLTEHEKRTVKSTVDANTWRHDRIMKGIVADLAEQAK